MRLCVWVTGGIILDNGSHEDLRRGDVTTSDRTLTGISRGGKIAGLLDRDH